MIKNKTTINVLIVMMMIVLGSMPLVLGQACVGQECFFNVTINVTGDGNFPNVTLIDPVNNTQTSNTTINFTANASDDTALDFANLTIVNETGGEIINSTIIDLDGSIFNFFGVVYTFLADGLFNWFYTVFDLFGNSATTFSNQILIDTINPVVIIETLVDVGTDILPVVYNYNYSITDENLISCSAELDMISGGLTTQSIQIVDEYGLRDLNNYSVQLFLNHSTGMDADFGDVRFSQGAEVLGYWIENYTTTTNATIWVKVPQIPVNSSTVITMTFSGVALTTTSNFSEAFLYGDDFEVDTSAQYTNSSACKDVTITGGQLVMSTDTALDWCLVYPIAEYQNLATDNYVIETQMIFNPNIEGRTGLMGYMNAPAEEGFWHFVIDDIDVWSMNAGGFIGSQISVNSSAFFKFGQEYYQSMSFEDVGAGVTNVTAKFVNVSDATDDNYHTVLNSSRNNGTYALLGYNSNGVVDSTHTYDYFRVRTFAQTEPSYSIISSGALNCSATESSEVVSTAGVHNLTLFADDVVANMGSDSELFYVLFHNYSQFTEKPVVTEGDLVDFNLSVTMTNITNTYAFLEYEGTEYEADSFSIVDDTINFDVEIIIPAGAGNTTGKPADWNWIYTIYNENYTLVNNYTTSVQQQTAFTIQIDDCTNFTETILNFTLHEEELDVPINASLNPIIEVEVTIFSTGSEEIFTQFNQTYNSTNAVVCVPTTLLNATDYVMESIVGYRADGYSQEFWYLDDGNLSFNNISLDAFTTKDVILRDLVLEDSTTFLFTFYNELFQKEPDAIVTLYRKYIGEGTFKEVERGKLDNNGETHLHLVQEDVIYKFLITRDGETLFFSSEYNAKCVELPCAITLEEDKGIGDIGDADNLAEGTYTLTSDGDTRTVTLDFNLNETGEMNLSVFTYSNNPDDGDQLVASEFTISKTGTLDVFVPESFGNQTYYAVVRHNDFFTVSRWVTFEEDAFLKFGTLGIFLAMILILTLGLIAVNSGGYVIVFLLLGLLIASIMKLIKMDFVLLMVVVSAGVLLLYKLHKRGST